MKRILISMSTIAALAASVAAASAGDTLTVYTYESFTAEWGPGPQVEAAFEAQCGCDLRFVSVADGVALLNRLRLEGGKTDADIVLGLDTNLTAEAKASGFFVPHGIDTGAVAVPGGWTDDVFVPYDYGYFAVIYDTQAISDPPKSMAEFLDGDPSVKIAIQDPRTSTPGLGLMLWIKKLYGDDAPKAYAKLAEQVLTVTPGWSESYGLFTNGEVPMVLSYTTSPAYHMIAEETKRYQAPEFAEGHYMQIEVAAQTAKGAENPLAGQFLEFMISPAFQDIIPETNWMLPAAPTSKPLAPAFSKIVQPETALLFPPEEVAENRKAWVNEWLAVMSR
jgi:thiamine transport system substrate-binding protein